MVEISPDTWKTLLCIADTFLPAVKPEEIQDLVGKDFDKAKIEELAKLTPSTTPGFQENLEALLNRLPSDRSSALLTVIGLLGRRSTALSFTGSFTLLTNMKPADRESTLLGWHNSMIGSIREMYRGLYDMCTVSWVKANKLGLEAMGQPDKRVDFDKIDFEQLKRLEITNVDKDSTIETDVVIVGSGSGAGVAALRLAKAGHKVLVLEKGKYYHPSEMNWTDDESQVNLYENGGVMMTENSSLTILAGSNVGGGSTISWGACTKTPDDIRKHWSATVPWYNEDVYSEALDHVMEQMGCNTEHNERSHANQTVHDGCKKLGYEVHELPQNTGNQPHPCGLCGKGCPTGVKQSGSVNWLKEAVDNGAEILDQTVAMKITKSGTKATGVQAKVQAKYNLTVTAKKVIVAGGALHTPGLLQRSGFKNKNIGQNLHVHPVSTIYGEFAEAHDMTQQPIVTVGSSQVARRDGLYGAMLEVNIPLPMIHGHFNVWRSGNQSRKDLLKFKRMVGITAICRDRDGGRVYYKDDDQLRPRAEYSPSKYDCESMHAGVVAACDILYIQGARRIFPPMSTIPVFESDENECSIDDKKYQAWRAKLKEATLKPVNCPLGSAHQLSTCRMGSTTDDAAVNKNGQLFECDNVYVADASVLPDAVGNNPIVTIMATAHVIAGFVEQQL